MSVNGDVTVRKTWRVAVVTRVWVSTKPEEALQDKKNLVVKRENAYEVVAGVSNIHQGVVQRKARQEGVRIRDHSQGLPIQTGKAMLSNYGM